MFIPLADKLQEKHMRDSSVGRYPVIGPAALSQEQSTKS
jgi:hypothetical protein